MTTIHEFESYQKGMDGSPALHERITVVETDVKTLKGSVDALVSSIGELAQQFKSLNERIGSFMVLWQTAVPIKLVLVMFGILCACFFGAEIFKEALSMIHKAYGV